MKRYIQEKYLMISYDNQTISRLVLRERIQEARDRVRDEDIAILYDSWKDHCNAIIRANGGPTR